MHEIAERPGQGAPGVLGGGAQPRAFVGGEGDRITGEPGRRASPRRAVVMTSP